MKIYHLLINVEFATVLLSLLNLYVKTTYGRVISFKFDLTIASVLLKLNFTTACQTDDYVRVLQLDHQNTLFTSSQIMLSFKNLSIQVCASIEINSQRQCNPEEIERWIVNGSNMVTLSFDNLTHSGIPLLFKVSIVGGEYCPNDQLFLQIDSNGKLYHNYNYHNT